MLATKIAACENAQRSQDQSCHSGIYDTDRALVIMPVTKQHCDDNNSNPIGRRRSSAQVGRASEQISSISDLFAERRPGPDQKQPIQVSPDIPVLPPFQAGQSVGGDPENEGRAEVANSGSSRARPGNVGKGCASRARPALPSLQNFGSKWIVSIAFKSWESDMKKARLLFGR